ncbi:glycoside hydrolase family 97 protein [Shewanella cyperi]|uniref:glycoside hydrolase family 97 protein n=1 Tax=Shewanella cyperi TaxID=2814292 RepID=UPI001A954310|nr:glycoside hydrolase family 97 protein [Shewanella cyperi]QSX41412.1 glycoside hydrolase family 97 protein [Shewanella cyperi]
MFPTLLRPSRASRLQIGLIGAALMLWQSTALAGQFSLRSPDDSLEIRLSTGTHTETGTVQGLEYQLWVDGQQQLQPSRIAMAFDDGSAFGPGARVTDQTPVEVDEEVLPEIPLRQAKIRNHYRGLTLSFDTGFQLELRAFNEGVAYRFIAGKHPATGLKGETAEFNLAKGSFGYFPFEKNFRSATQPLFTPTATKSLGGDQLGSLPALFVSKGVNLLLTETDLQHYPGLWLRGDGRGGVFGVHPRELDKEGNEIDSHASIEGNRSFPWRIIGVARSDAALLDNQLSFLLSEPSRIKDVSWIKPGKIAWDWYNENHLKGVDFKSGINTDTYKYFIDFAAKFGIENILLDDGWSTHEDVLTVLPGIDMQAILAHAKEKGVKVQLWVPWSGLEPQMEQAMKRYAQWGISGLKIDFMNSDSQRMVDFYWRTAATAAKYKLMVNFHGAYKPAGIHRTYPNVLTREGVKGLENHKWSDSITPTHNLHLPFIRMITGPMDYTPGAMRNAQRKNFAAIFSRPMSLGTRAHQVAMYVLYESPLQMLADTPSSYEAEPEIPRFIAAIPTVWDDYRVLEASIGDYLVMARRAGKDWFIGAMTNEQPRDFQLDLGFLAPGRYRLTLCRDGINADENAEDYRIETREVNAGDRLAITLAPGGGWAAKVTPL